MTSVIFAYNFDIKDYSLTFSENTLVIKEHAKDRTKIGKAKVCSDKLTSVIQTLFSRHTGISREESKKLHFFIKTLIAKVEQKVSQQLPYKLGNLLALLQKILGFGVLGALQNAQKKLLQLPIVEQAAIKIRNEIVEKEDCLRLQREHELLITHIGTPVSKREFFGKEDLKEKIKIAFAESSFFAKILKQALSENSILLITEALQESKVYANIIKRFEQVRSTLLEEKQLPLVEILRLVFFIEEKIFNTDKAVPSFFHKKKTKLARNLQFDAEKQEVYLLADYHLSLGKDEGAFKKMAFCMRLEKNNFGKKPEVPIYLVTKSDGLILSEIRYDIANSRLEIAYCRRFIGVRGLVQFRTAAFYTDVKVQHASLIFTYCNGGNLDTLLFRHKKPLSFQEKLLIADELMSGLQFMHRNKIAHGDLKLENSLCELDDKGAVVAARLCDFGICYNTEEESSETRKIPELYQWGHGGTAEFSPPELYGTLHFKGDYYALDVWGIGAMLYEIFLEKPLPWRKDIDATTKLNFNDAEKRHESRDTLQKARHLMHEKLINVIEVPLQRLSLQATLTKEETFLQLIYKMMRLHPHERPTITAAHAELIQLKTRYQI